MKVTSAWAVTALKTLGRSATAKEISDQFGVNSRAVATALRNPVSTGLVSQEINKGRAAYTFIDPATQYYVISVRHTLKRHRYVTFWRPDNAGYCWKLSRAGRYTKNVIRAHQDEYYNRGDNDIAVPCSIVDAMTVMTTPSDMIDGPDGPAVLNTPANWRKLIANVISPTPLPTKPACGLRAKKGGAV